MPCRFATPPRANSSLCAHCLATPFQYDTLVTMMTMLKGCPREVTFDLAARAEYRDPERMERTVHVSPLATNVTTDMVKVRVHALQLGKLKPLCEAHALQILPTITPRKCSTRRSVVPFAP